MYTPKTDLSDAKKMFWKKGPCSTCFFFLLNREFNQPAEAEERASEPFCGGMLLGGDQCGMLWGAVLGAGREAHRRQNDPDQAIALAVSASRLLVESFENRFGSVDCRDVTRCDFTKRFGLAKFFFAGRFIACFRHSGHWAPEAVQKAAEGLSSTPDYSQPPSNCACEVAKKMGASEEEMVTVAGLAGGLGFSGQACGALAASIWLKTLVQYRTNPEKSFFPTPEEREETIKAFHAVTDSKTLCREISGQNFESLDDHTEFIKNGGCAQLIEALAQMSRG